MFSKIPGVGRQHLGIASSRQIATGQTLLAMAIEVKEDNHLEVPHASGLRPGEFNYELMIN